MRRIVYLVTGLAFLLGAPSPVAAYAPVKIPAPKGFAQYPRSEVERGENPSGLCALYDPDDDLLTQVDQQNALPREFEPADLAPAPLERQNAYLDKTILLRQVVHQPLSDLLAASNAAGLRLVVISGHRSYTEQVLAHEKWKELYPERADVISARPGHSEHQLGTVVDFSTPRLSYQFYEVFAQTSEGQWLQGNAADHGFTLSYPEWAVDQTGYEWEPWHFRYVGVELAQELAAQQMTLTAYMQHCESAALQKAAGKRGLMAR